MYSHVYEIVRRRAASLPDAVAIGGQEGLAWKTLTGRELLDRIDRLAPELADLGVREGDRVVLWLPNAWRTPVYLFALWKLGAVVVPFDREMNPEAAAQIIDSVDARLVLVGSGERPPWAHGRSLTEWWEPGSVNEGERGGGGVGVQVEQGQESAPHPLIPSSPLPLSDWAPPAEELATISFTSGTTGHPKGCMLTHANFCFEVEALPATIRLDATCRLGSILPLSHVFELTCGLLYPLACGAAIHYIPSRRPPEILRVLREQRISHMLVVPQLLTLMGGALDRQLRDRLPRPLYGAMMAVAPRLPLAARRRLFWPAHRHLGGQLRVMGSAGAPLPAETQVLWERLGVRVVQGYGASETAPVIASGKEDGSTPVGSVGRALPGVEIRLTAEGEALARGPNVMRGYWQDAERTAEALADGWYHTGDLATLDERGNLRIVGRSKELIVLPSGMKVWPTDVEDVLRERPEVRDAAVMGISTAGAGLKLHAYLLPAGGASRAADLGALVAACNGRLARHQRLTTASWWPGDEFPRTALGKVRRHLLPPPAVGDTVPVEAALAADDPVAQAVAGVARATVTRPDQTLGGLGIDSFGLVDLALALEEKTGKAIGDGDLSLDMTVEQARAFVLTAPDVEAGAAGERLDAAEGGSAEAAEWPYTWGRHFRWLSLPIDGLYRFYVTRTTVLGAEYLTGLPERTILAGVHRSFTDMPLVYHVLKRSPARGLARRLVVATAAVNFARYRGILTTWAALAFGLYPLRRLSERDVSLRSLERLAERGAAILIFPQGWHVPPELEQVDDPTARFRPGVAYLAEALGAAVVPFGLAGCERIVTPQIDEFTGRRVLGVPFALRHGPLAIAFGPPLCPAAGEPPAAFTVRLQTACYALARRAESALNCPDADNSPCDSQERLS